MNSWFRLMIVIGWFGIAGPDATAENPAAWTFDQTIARTDTIVTWTSPTSVDAGFDLYEYRYEITRILATAILTIDVTDQVTAGFNPIGTGLTNALPAVLLNESLADATTGTTADVLIEVDPQGFGQAEITNIALGSVDVFGTPVNISSVRIEADVSIEGFFQAAGDYNFDRAVDTLDYDAWSVAYGATDQFLPDGNNDGVVDAADYTVWRDAVAAPAAAATPEPATLGLLLIGSALGLIFRAS